MPALAMSGRNTIILTNVAAIHAGREQRDKVEAIYAELNERAATWYIGFAARACVAAGAQRWVEARELLAKGIAEHEPWIAYWKLYAWRPIWKDETCAAMMHATSLFQRVRV